MLDVTNKTATAQVNSLEHLPIRSLSLEFPLANQFDTKVSLVNSGSADAHVSINGYGVDGTVLTGSPAATIVAADRQLLGSVGSLGFNINTVSGIVTVESGTLFEALPFVTGIATHLQSLFNDVRYTVLPDGIQDFVLARVPIASQ